MNRLATAIMAATVGVASCAWQTRGHGAEAMELDVDPNADGFGFGRTFALAQGPTYSQNDAARDGANDLLAQTQTGQSAFTGAFVMIPISNGENGRDLSAGGVNFDLPNVAPANPVFAAVGNPGGRLANGNVLRFSAWVRLDPSNPITVAPQVEPVFKLQLWKEALSVFSDFGAVAIAPSFGDMILDTDLTLSRGSWVDLDGDGAVLDPTAASQGRLRTATANAWTLVEATYEVEDALWSIGGEQFTVADVEEIRANILWGDYVGTSFAADGADGGTLWLDNLLVEVFATAAAVTPNANPNPSVAEPATLPPALVLGALLWARVRRKVRGA